MIYENLRDCIRLIQRNEILKKKITFLLISANKDSLYLGFHFYEIAIIFLQSLKF